MNCAWQKGYKPAAVDVVGPRRGCSLHDVVSRVVSSLVRGRCPAGTVQLPQSRLLAQTTYPRVSRGTVCLSCHVEWTLFVKEREWLQSVLRVLLRCRWWLEESLAFCSVCLERFFFRAVGGRKPTGNGLMQAYLLGVRFRGFFVC